MLTTHLLIPVYILLCSLFNPQENIPLSGGKPCDMDGTAKAEKVKKLNLLKNRYHAPRPKDFDYSISLHDLLKPGNDMNRFRSSQAVRITGYVLNVKVGGKETCNCHEKDAKFRDTHIELVLTPRDTDERMRFIAEVTPRWRAIMAKQGIDWSTAALEKKLEKRKVTIEGWLMFDTEHKSQAENTKPGNPRNWRATSWEVHPVTSITVK